MLKRGVKCRVTTEMHEEAASTQLVGGTNDVADTDKGISCDIPKGLCGDDRHRSRE